MVFPFSAASSYTLFVVSLYRTWSMCVCKKTTYKLVVRRWKKTARLRWYMRLVRLHGFIPASRECDSVPFASIYCLCSCKLCVFCLCMCRNQKKNPILNRSCMVPFVYVDWTLFLCETFSFLGAMRFVNCNLFITKSG